MKKMAVDAPREKRGCPSFYDSKNLLPLQRVCMREVGGKEDGVNEDFAGQSSANFLSSAA